MANVSGNPELDFKDQNPMISVLGEFSRIYKDRKDASRFCWAMTMIENTNEAENPLAKLPTKEERVKEVRESYFDIDIECEDYKSLANYFSRFILSKEENLFKILSDKVEEIVAHLKSLDLSIESDYKKSIDIATKMPNIWKGLDQIKKEMMSSNDKSKIRGDAKISKREEFFKNQ